MGDPYIKDDQLDDLRRRVTFVRVPLEEQIAAIRTPVAPPPSRPFPHAHNELGDKFGMKGYEVQAYLHAALSEMPSHPMLTEKFAEFMMLAKLVVSGNDVCEKLLEDGRQNEQLWRERELRENHEYQQALRNYSATVLHRKQDWGATRGTVFHKWHKIVRSLVAMARKHPDLDQAHENDRILFRYLESIGKAEIHGNMIFWINEDGLMDFSFDDIMAAMDHFTDNKVVVKLHPAMYEEDIDA